jgi:6,7-dimethyl-8-ribityllumazine synthase
MSEATPALSLKRGDARGLKVRIVVSEFNRHVTSRLVRSAQARLKALGGFEAPVDWVPGALELPLAARWALKSKPDAVVALGCVIRGETSHYDLVCRGALDGLMRVSLDSATPVLFGVVTVENEAQALARSNGGPKDAGRHALDAALAMALLRRRNAATAKRRAA